MAQLSDRRFVIFRAEDKALAFRGAFVVHFSSTLEWAEKYVECFAAEHGGLVVFDRDTETCVIEAGL